MPAYELKKAIAKVGEKPMGFSLYKGEDADQVLVSSAAPTAAQLKEVEKECGKMTRVLKGVCFREGEVLVFATKTAPAPQWKMQLSKILKERKCQGVSKIDLRQLGPGQSDEVSEPAESGVAATATDSASASGEARPKAALSAEWQMARVAAVRGIDDLVGKLRATGDGDAITASGIVQQLSAGFPTGLDMALASLEKATATADAKAAATARTQAKNQAEACLAFLKTNQKLIAVCEGNAFGASVAISQPLTGALTSIFARLK